VTILSVLHNYFDNYVERNYYVHKITFLICIQQRSKILDLSAKSFFSGNSM